jgi:hypothetical protein
MKANFNIGYLLNIGDLVSENNLVPSKRVPIGLSLYFPGGIFFEAQTDINRYGDGIPLAKNPKRCVVGIDYASPIGINFLSAFEYGTWGTGDPPIHRWSYGWYEDVTQWDVTVGASYPIRLLGSTALMGTVEGKFMDKTTGEPIIAQMKFKGLGINIITDEDGYYKVNMPAGKYIAVVELPGYEEMTKEIEVCEGKIQKLNFVLTSK